MTQSVHALVALVNAVACLSVSYCKTWCQLPRNGCTICVMARTRRTWSRWMPEGALRDKVRSVRGAEAELRRYMCATSVPQAVPDTMSCGRSSLVSNNAGTCVSGGSGQAYVLHQVCAVPQHCHVRDRPTRCSRQCDVCKHTPILLSQCVNAYVCAVSVQCVCNFDHEGLIE